jgi:hypothetical protein
MPTFKATFCDPFKEDIVQLGELPANSVIDIFEKIPWIDYLQRADAAPDDVQYSPSFGLENVETRVLVECSIVGPVDKHQWYIFFKRPKMVKAFFGLTQKMDDGYLSELHGQTKSDVTACLNALINGDVAFLENKIK